MARASIGKPMPRKRNRPKKSRETKPSPCLAAGMLRKGLVAAVQPRLYRRHCDSAAISSRGAAAQNCRFSPVFDVSIPALPLLLWKDTPHGDALRERRLSPGTGRSAYRPAREQLMAPRSAWKGYLRISLVSFPVQAYVGSSGESPGIRFNQLHRPCHSRIRYVKTCPIHGEVRSDEIVSVRICQGPVRRNRSRRNVGAAAQRGPAISVKTFVPPNSVDPVYSPAARFSWCWTAKSVRRPMRCSPPLEADGLSASAGW